MIRLTVRRFGSSLGVILPKDVIHRLHTKAGDRLFLMEAPDGAYRLTHKMAMAGDIFSRYRDTLHTLVSAEPRASATGTDRAGVLMSESDHDRSVPVADARGSADGGDVRYR